MKKRKILIAFGVVIIILYVFRSNLIDPIIREIKSKIKSDFNNAISLEKQDKPEPNKSIATQIAFISDIHNDNENLEKTISLLNSSNVSLVYILGDLTDTGTEKELSTVQATLKKLKKTYYVIPGDHDYWAGRQVEKNAPQIFNKYFSQHTPPLNLHQNNTDILYVNNADLYSGVPDFEITNFKSALAQSKAKTIFIISHQAIYHPLTIHRMGYINNEENEAVLNQAKELQNIIASNKQKNITIINGDLHNAGKYTFLNTQLSAYSIGAITRERNFQTPRYAIANIYVDNSVEIKNIEL